MVEDTINPEDFVDLNCDVLWAASTAAAEGLGILIIIVCNILIIIDFLVLNLPNLIVW